MVRRVGNDAACFSILISAKVLSGASYEIGTTRGAPHPLCRGMIRGTFHHGGRCRPALSTVQQNWGKCLLIVDILSFDNVNLEFMIQ